jgi:hypothetical protein
LLTVQSFDGRVHDPQLGGPSDPSRMGGSLRLLSAGHFDVTYPLPATGWRGFPLGGGHTFYRYLDAFRQTGNHTVVTKLVAIDAPAPSACP